METLKSDRVHASNRVHNPLEGNAFKARDDAARGVRDLLYPLLRCFDETGSRCVPGMKHAHFDDLAVACEGVCRPLWGIAPYLAGGFDWPDASHFLKAAVRGTDASHPGYWGPPRDLDQRVVEAAAISTSLMLIPERFGHADAIQPMLQWLHRVNLCNAHPNNWRWFKVLTALALDRAGKPIDHEQLEADLDFLESCALDNGWYADGHKEQRDYYIAMAMHFYALIFTKLALDPYRDRSERFRHRASLFAHHFLAWFGDSGAAIPFGRSLTYRFAACAFWGALAFADVLPDGMSWGHIRGLWARHMRWWSNQPIADAQGILNVGYVYPSEFMSEQYNSSASPYWCMKAFLPLALPPGHGFWQSTELPHPLSNTEIALPQPSAHAIVVRSDGDTLMLTGGQHGEHKLRAAPAKYSKFAYSSRFAFSVPSDTRSPGQIAPDSSLCFAESATGPWLARDRCDHAHTCEDYQLTHWNISKIAEISTLLIPDARFHIRIHLIHVLRSCSTVEGGFAQPLDQASVVPDGETHPTAALLWSDLGTTAIVDLSPQSRTPQLLRTDPGTNLYFPRATIPVLMHTLQPGHHVLACAAYASPTHKGFAEVSRSAPRIESSAESILVTTRTKNLTFNTDRLIKDHDNQLGQLGTSTT